jgi:hypothetical protein
MSIPALNNITREYLQNITSASMATLQPAAVAADASVKAGILAQIYDISNNLPTMLCTAASAGKNDINITIAMRTDHTGLCGDGIRRLLDSDTFERYLQLNESSQTIQEILASKLSITLTLSQLSSPTNLPYGSFYRSYNIAWK